jgi:hypothetical protein
MDTASQVLAYFQVLAWPFVAFTAIVLFRDSIRRLLAGVEELEGPGFKVRVRQRIAQGNAAAEEALQRSVPRRDSEPRHTIRNLVFIISQVEAVPAVSKRIAGGIPNPLSDPLDKMRSALTRLDTVISAIIIIFATAESADQEARTWLDMTPDGVDSHLRDLTGVRGWSSVIESRNILRGTLIVACGSKGKAVGEVESDKFTAVASLAFEQWERLIRLVVETGRSRL